VDVKIREVLREDVAAPTAAELDEARQAARAGLTNACVSHILVATEVEANDVLDRLERGEEFGELATELSTDTGSAANNGILPCGTLEQYVAPFRNAAMEATVGEVHPTPVESQFGFHIIQVTDRTDADESALPSDVDLTTTVQDATIFAELQEWFTGVMEGAAVTVDEQFGTWTPNPPGVTPPADGSTTTLPADGNTPTTSG
jgi:parvulin-like peptidyl-prolyl isomerase